MIRRISAALACAVLGISDPCTATDGPQEAVTGVVVFPPGSSAGHHIHHGVESGYVLSGEVEVVKDGVPLTTSVP